MPRCAFCSEPADYVFKYEAVRENIDGRSWSLQKFVKYACHEHTAAATSFAMCRSDYHKREAVERET